MKTFKRKRMGQTDLFRIIILSIFPILNDDTAQPSCNPFCSRIGTQLTSKLPPPSRTTRCHSFKLHKRGSRLNVRANTFSNRVINTWNKLPDSVVNASSVNSFKNDVSAILFFSPVQVGEDITHQEQFIHNVSHSIPLTH